MFLKMPLDNKTTNSIFFSARKFLERKFEELVRVIAQKNNDDVVVALGRQDVNSGSRTTSVIEAISEVRQAIENAPEANFEPIIGVLEKIEGALLKEELDITPALKDIETAVKEIKIPEAKEPEKIQPILEALLTAVLGIRLEERDIDLSSVVGEIRALSKEIKNKNNNELVELLADVRDAVDNIQIKVPSTFKLDARQFNQLSVARGGGGGSTLPQVTRFPHGAKSSVGGTAVQMTTNTIKTTTGVIIKAATTNTGIVYVGDDSAVTANAVDGTDGFPLTAGESITLPILDASTIYLIASAAGQKVFWVAL